MMKIKMDKWITTIKDVKIGDKEMTEMSEYKYKDLGNLLDNVQMVEVTYPSGDSKRRENKLNKLGFYKMNIIWEVGERPQDPAKVVFAR